MPKHSKEIQTDKGKLVDKIKEIIFFILCICLIFVTTLYVHDKLKEKQPTDIVNKFFTALKENNSQIANEFSNYEELIESFDTMIMQEDYNISNVKNELFKEITWTVEDVKIENDNTTVIVEVTNKNFKNVITKWMKEIVILKSVGEEMTNEIALQKLEKVISQENEYKTIIKKITLNKKSEKWMIQVDDELRDLVYPGIDSVIEVLNSI